MEVVEKGREGKGQEMYDHQRTKRLRQCAIRSLQSKQRDVAVVVVLAVVSLDLLISFPFFFFLFSSNLFFRTPLVLFGFVNRHSFLVSQSPNPVSKQKQTNRKKKPSLQTPSSIPNSFHTPKYKAQQTPKQPFNSIFTYSPP